MPTFTETLSSTFTGTDESPLSEGGAWATMTGEASFSRTSNQAAAGRRDRRRSRQEPNQDSILAYSAMPECGVRN